MTDYEEEAVGEYYPHEGYIEKLEAKVERLQAALKQVAAEADGGRLSANDDELRDWLMAIRDVARRALEPKP